MKKIYQFGAVLLLIAFADFQFSDCIAQGTAFTYQGQLQSGSSLADGTYNFTFSLFNTNSGGVAVAGPVTNSAVAVSSGLFTTTIDFGSGVWNGATNWLEIAVETNGTASFTTLAPRQELTPVPYAIFAENSVSLANGVAIGMGSGNIISSAGTVDPFIGGGYENQIQSNSFDSVIVGGVLNIIGTNADRSFIGSGQGNSIGADTFWGTYGVIGGGQHNTIQPSGGLSVIGGGSGNTIESNGYWSVISGGVGNTITTNGYLGTVGGGYGNEINEIWSTIGGGFQNTVNGYGATIAGGRANVVAGLSPYATIGGGYDNYNSAFFYGTIGGGISNSIYATASTVGGGFQNYVYGNYGTVPGGLQNTAFGTASAVGGGANNYAAGVYTTVAGGLRNTAWEDYAMVGGGYDSFASGYGAVVSGGGYDGTNFSGNTASGNASVVGGGLNNTASGSYATVAGGSDNFAGGFGSFAAGMFAQAPNDGAFVWADGSGGYFSSTAPNQFAVRAAGGVQFVTGSGISLAIENENGFVPGITASSSQYNGHMRFRNALEIWPDSAGTNGGYLDIRGLNALQTIIMTGTNGNITCTSLTQTSDRNAKQDFAPVSPSQLLDKVVALPLSEWSYKMDAVTRHIGPMAQDFYSLFNIGPDDKHISVVDEGGVALAAIQGLNQKLETEVEAQHATITALQKQSAEMAGDLAEQKKANARLEARLEELAKAIAVTPGK